MSSELFDIETFLVEQQENPVLNEVYEKLLTYLCECLLIMPGQPASSEALARGLLRISGAIDQLFFKKSIDWGISHNLVKKEREWWYFSVPYNPEQVTRELFRCNADIINKLRENINIPDMHIKIIQQTSTVCELVCSERADMKIYNIIFILPVKKMMICNCRERKPCRHQRYVLYKTDFKGEVEYNEYE